jgi:DNA-binding transcriptional MocR family regulator
MKASWIAARGPKFLVQEAMQRIEMIADTFLSMNAPVQYAMPTWLAVRNSMQEQIRDRIRENLALLDVILQGSAIQRLALQGGWTAVLRVPRTVRGGEFVAVALEQGVLVQPGNFYGLGEARVVVSLLTPPEIWAAGLRLLPVQ